MCSMLEQRARGQISFRHSRRKFTKESQGMRTTDTLTSWEGQYFA